MLNRYPFLICLLLSGNLFALEDLYVERSNDETAYYKINIANDSLDLFVPTKKITTPVGSVWKLFVYTYIKENELSYPPYTCNGLINDEVFCCSKGESINENEALAKSCGPYFSPFRLNISQKKWRSFWKQREVSFEWICDLDSLRPGVIVSVEELLRVLEKIKGFPKAKSYLDENLMRVVLNGTAQNFLSRLGSFSRFKTFTWNNPSSDSKFVGGLAGWLNSDKFIWAMGRGRSSEFLDRTSALLGNHWMKTSPSQSRECVTVRYFHDYGIKEVVDLSTGKKVENKSLRGTYLVRFISGREIRLNSDSDIILRKKNNQLFIDGKMSTVKYIARVIERELDSRYKSASEAFSIVIRSYLFERAKKIGQCFHVIDSSKFQRVSANIPSAKTLAIATKTSGLVLNNVAGIRYHLNKMGKNLISWTKAKGLDLLGNDLKQILKYFYPNSSIAYKIGKYSHACKEIGKANLWLTKKVDVWHRFLVRRPGYERPASFNVCKLSSGAPFVNMKTNEIFVKGFESFENQYSIAHEYLHLAFKFHPVGRNEQEMDSIAKKLVITF